MRQMAQIVGLSGESINLWNSFLCSPRQSIQGQKADFSASCQPISLSPQISQTRVALSEVFSSPLLYDSCVCLCSLIQSTDGSSHARNQFVPRNQ